MPDIVEVVEIVTEDVDVDDIVVGVDVDVKVVEFVIVVVVLVFFVMVLVVDLVTWSSFVGLEGVSVALLIIFPSVVAANESFFIKFIKDPAFGTSVKLTKTNII